MKEGSQSFEQMFNTITEKLLNKVIDGAENETDQKLIPMLLVGDNTTNSKSSTNLHSDRRNQ